MGIDFKFLFLLFDFKFYENNF